MSLYGKDCAANAVANAMLVMALELRCRVRRGARRWVHHGYGLPSRHELLLLMARKIASQTSTAGGTVKALSRLSK